MKPTALLALMVAMLIQFVGSEGVLANPPKGEPTPTESSAPVEASGATKESKESSATPVKEETTKKSKPERSAERKADKKTENKTEKKTDKTTDKKTDKKSEDKKAESSKPDPERTADAVLKRLQAGNLRYLNDRSVHSRFDAQRRMETAELGQKPYATVLGCSDARVPPEVVFDQGFAELFVIRVAGNVCGESELASAEYGTKYLGTQLLVVLGHSKCGAVDATLKGAELEGSLPKLVSMIEPAVESAKRKHPNLKDEELLNEAIESNCRQTINQLMKGSTVLRELVQSNKLKIVGAIRNIQSGKVHWIK